MKFAKLSLNGLTRPRLLSFFSLASLMFSMALFCQIGQAQQQAQLSLADILIGLRSKKVTLDERNKLLSEAIKERGITFALTPEIEAELTTTGASGELIAAVRQKAEKVAAKPAPAMIPVSMPTTPATTAPDAAFYRNRANENNLKGEFDIALEDYGKAIELNPGDALSYFNRGRIYWGKKSYDLAILDFDKAIELNPKDAAAYSVRADLHEKKGNAAQAVADYQKVTELDANNQTAKTNLKRLLDEQARLEAKQKEAEQAKLIAKQPAPVVAAPAPVKTEMPAVAAPTAPKTLELGQLNGNAVKLAMPIYPDIARKLSAVGKVTVQITIDEEGKVVSAKATSGNSMLRGPSEDAARRSKFKPATANGQPIKATGFITYNFVDAP